MSIDGVLSVVFSGPKVVAIVDPKKPKPDLDPLQRTVIRAGNVTFEDFDGTFKDDSFACGTQIVAQNTNPLFQGISDPVLAETGTLGHFISTEMEEELETDEEEEEEAGYEHYGVTIGHILQDDTEEAVLYQTMVNKL